MLHKIQFVHVNIKYIYIVYFTVYVLNMLNIEFNKDKMTELGLAEEDISTITKTYTSYHEKKQASEMKEIEARLKALNNFYGISR